MKGFLLDAFNIGIWVFVITICFVILTTLWINVKPQIIAVTPNVTGQHIIGNLGDSFFLNSGDTVLVFFYFMLVIAMFVSAAYEGAGIITFPIGLIILIPLIIVTFGISDLAHAFLTNPNLASAASHYKNTLYIYDNLPIFTAVLTLAYLVFVVTRRQGPTQGIGGPGAVLTG